MGVRNLSAFMYDIPGIFFKSWTYFLKLMTDENIMNLILSKHAL